jgi:membrane-associated phospholipid phosphatase
VHIQSKKAVFVFKNSFAFRRSCGNTILFLSDLPWIQGKRMGAPKNACIFGVAVLLVSLARRLINAKRPYEIYGFYIEKPKDKSGRSFPSRHVFSSFLIATLAYAFSPIFALILCGVSIILAVCRVLLGIHFISDVVFGALIGIFSGALTVILIQ